MNVFFTSDAHLFHHKVANLRGFTMDEWNNTFARMYVSMVKPGDQVWFLGDMTGGGRVPQMLELLARLPGEKHLILGNHDPAHPMHRNAHRQQQKYFTAFSSIAPAARRRILGREVLLSHFPYTGDNGPDRFTQWRLRDEGLTLLHGHVHSTEKVRGTQVHVGLDAWDLKLVHLSEIEDLL